MHATALGVWVARTRYTAHRRQAGFSHSKWALRFTSGDLELVINILDLKEFQEIC